MRKLAILVIFLLLLPAASHKPTIDDRSPPYELKYHSYEELLSLALSINSSYIKPILVGYSYNNSPIYVFKISTGGSKPAIVRNFGQHAREYITSETALFLLYYIDALLSGSINDTHMLYILEHFDVYIVLCANPDGHDIAMFHNERQRKNVEPIDEDSDGLTDEDPPEDSNGDGYIDLYYSPYRSFLGTEGIDNDGDGKSGEDRIGGVDPNRNRPSFRQPNPDPSSEVYPGTKPLSEPETRSLYKFFKSVGPVVLVDIHSGIKALLYPPGTEYGSTTLQDIFSEMSLFVMQLGRDAMPSINLYPAYGTLDDTGYFDIHAVSYTLEIFGNSSRPKYEDLGDKYRVYGVKRMFNPMPSKLLEAMREASKVIIGTTFIASKHLEKPSAEFSYTISDRLLFIKVKPSSSIVREGFALLVGNNITRYIQLQDYLNGSLGVALSLPALGLPDGEYALIIYIHAILNRTYKIFFLNITGYFEDSDHDSLADSREDARGVEDPQADDDGDGLSNLLEYRIGTNPKNNDTDFDGVADSEYSICLLAPFRYSFLDDLPFDSRVALYEVVEDFYLALPLGSNRHISVETNGKVLGSDDILIVYDFSYAYITIKAGEHERSRSLSYNAPKLEASISLSGSTLSITIKAIDDDPRLNLSIYIDGELKKRTEIEANKTYTYTFELSQGKHSVKIVVEDPSGLKDELSKEVEVESGSSLVYVAALVIALALIVLLIAYVYSKKRFFPNYLNKPS